MTVEMIAFFLIGYGGTGIFFEIVRRRGERVFDLIVMLIVAILILTVVS